MSPRIVNHQHQMGADIACRFALAAALAQGRAAIRRFYAPNQLSRGPQVPGAFPFPRVFLLRQQLPLALTRQLGIERATALCHFHSRAGFRRGANIPCKPFEHIRQDRSEGLSSHLPFLSQRPSPDSHDAIEKDLTYAQRFFASGAKADD